MRVKHDFLMFINDVLREVKVRVIETGSGIGLSMPFYALHDIILKYRHNYVLAYENVTLYYMADHSKLFLIVIIIHCEKNCTDKCKTVSFEINFFQAYTSLPLGRKDFIYIVFLMSIYENFRK